MDSDTSTKVQECVPLLFVEDILRSVEFYRSKLGFVQTMQWEPEGVLSWCRIERDGAALMLQGDCENLAAGITRGLGVVFYFNCDDVFRIHAEFAANGLPLADPLTAFYGMDQLELTDPDGYQLCFQSVTKGRARPMRAPTQM